MIFGALLNRLRMVKSVGIHNAFRAYLHAKIQSPRSLRVMQKTTSHIWPTITRGQTFAQFWNVFKTRPLPFAQELFTLDKTEVVRQADKFVATTFDILGSGPTTFDRIPWHTDFRLRQAAKLQGQEKVVWDCEFNPAKPYHAISITSGIDWNISKDIKIPWELSRFYQAPILGHAYLFTNDEKYLRALTEQIKDWIGSNPYRFGVNWLCPMEVAIRSLNWIYAISLVRSSLDCNSAELISCSLYDHFEYLEHNWEFYDSRTSNHYLSNIVGYLACSWFFSVGPEKTNWAVKELFAEMEKTVFEEGANYEGSTAYHGLVTELFWHGLLMVAALQYDIPDTVREKFARMQEFATWTARLNIGDDDSGRVTNYPLYQSPKVLWKQELLPNRFDSESLHYPQFGLSLVAHQNWFVTLRHHAYQARQPSGHFHNDVGSCTLAAMKGKNRIPLFVDPGSYLYTPSQNWRNYFRSAMNHNSFTLLDTEPVPLDDRLWSLSLPEKRLHPTTSRRQCFRKGICVYEDPAYRNVSYDFALEETHRLYSRFGLTAHRTIRGLGGIVTIEDTWQSEEALPLLPPTVWNFTLAPDITPFDCDGILIVLERAGETLCLIEVDHSDALFSIVDGWYAPSYGVKVPTKQLRFQLPTVVDRPVTIKIEMEDN
jgi:hypothetical protein